MPLDSNFKDYDEYWGNRGFNKPSTNRAKEISSFLEPNSSILDIGCGDGTVMEYININNNPKDIVGIDISKRAVDYVNSKGFRAYEIDVLSERFAEFMNGKSFDYIIITEVLEHIQDPEIVITLLRNHVEKCVFVSIPNAGFVRNRLRLLFGRFPLVVIQQHIKEHIRFWTLKDFKYWAEYHGYRVEKVIATSGTGIKNLSLLEKWLPSLFANQIMYKMSVIEK